MAVEPLPELLDRLRSAGDQSALNELVTVLYGELHRLAARRLRAERDGHTLQTTALVHEAYLKLAGGSQSGFADRAHFLSVASRVMRQVLVDWARARNAKKRVAAETAVLEQAGKPVALLDLDRAIGELAAEDQSLARLVEMRYFGGMTAEEMAGVLDQSVHIVRHDLRLAQAWLRRKLNRGSPP